MKLGGFDIAGLAGIFLGGALYRVPVVVDGLISAVSALIAARLCPASLPYMLASHCSDEPAGQLLLGALGLKTDAPGRDASGRGDGRRRPLPAFGHGAGRLPRLVVLRRYRHGRVPAVIGGRMRALVIGGAASGKSEYAEALAVRLPVPRFYIATMMPFDDEDIRRIEKHRLQRAEKGFHTMERYTDLSGLILPEHGAALLECLGNLTANELFSDGGAGDGALDAILRGVDALEAQCADLVVVTNDVHSDGGSYEAETLKYIGTLGQVNSALAARFDCVVELVCGIPLLLKGVSA